MTYKTILFFILSSIIFISCKIKEQKIKSITTYHYTKNYEDSTKFLSEIEICSYTKSSDYHNNRQLNKNLYFDQDSSLLEISIYYFSPEGYTNNSFRTKFSIDKNTKEESLSIYQSLNDSIKNIFLEINYELNKGVELEQYSNVKIEYSSDSFSYTRILAPSKELVNHYRNLIFLYADSLEFISEPPFPDISTCNELYSSKYYINECISKENKYYQSSWIDSSYIADELIIEKETNFYYSEKKDSMNISKYYWSDESRNSYTEEHIKLNSNYPFYQFRYTLNPISKDTIYRMEMKSSDIGKGVLYTYEIIDNRTINKENSSDLRIPITKMTIKIWTNQYRQIVKFHSVGYSIQGHKLEYAYKGTEEKRKTTIDNRTIPEISYNQKYDIQAFYTVYKDGYYYNPKQYKKRSKKRTSQIYLPFDINQNSKTIEKNKKEKYEKRISSDSLKIFIIYYF